MLEGFARRATSSSRRNAGLIWTPCQSDRVAAQASGDMDNTALGVLRLPRLLRMHAYFAHVHALKLHSSLDASFVT